MISPVGTPTRAHAAAPTTCSLARFRSAGWSAPARDGIRPKATALRAAIAAIRNQRRPGPRARSIAKSGSRRTAGSRGGRTTPPERLPTEQAEHAPNSSERRLWTEVVRGRRRIDGGCPSRVRTSVHGFKVRCPTIRRRGSGRRSREDPGRSRTRDASRAEKWSGRRDSNPRPSPWQGDALPTEPLPLDNARPPPKRWCREPGSNWRHRDFQSRALPTELSRPDGQPGSVTRRRWRGYHGPQTRFKPPRRPDRVVWTPQGGPSLPSLPQTICGIGRPSADEAMSVTRRRSRV